MLLKQGAEAKIFLDNFEGKQCVVKERFVKKYRHPDLDSQITKERIRAERNNIKRCVDANVLVPNILNIDILNRKIYMEYFANSITSKEFINVHLSDDSLETKNKLSKLCNEIGIIIGKLHQNNIIHGDLTTSNFLVNPKSKDNFDDYDIITIDFGLSSYSQNVEDKAVDIYVLERALLSTHSELSDLFSEIMKAYKLVDNKQSDDVIAKFEEVRARGRKRTMIG